MSDPFSAGQIDWEDEVADLEATIERQGATIRLLGDTLLLLFPELTRIEPGMAPAAKPLKDVIESAYRAASDWGEGDFRINLEVALDHPVVVALLDAWATKEG